MPRTTPVRRGFDFAHALLRAFLDPQRMVAQDTRRDYGGDRYRLLGMIDGQAYVVVYTVRDSAIRIISAPQGQPEGVADYEHNARQDGSRRSVTFPEGRIDPARVDATTEAEVAEQEQEDEAEALQDMARYTRRVRRRMGLSQTELARRVLP